MGLSPKPFKYSAISSHQILSGFTIPWFAWCCSGNLFTMDILLMVCWEFWLILKIPCLHASSFHKSYPEGVSGQWRSVSPLGIFRILNQQPSAMQLSSDTTLQSLSWGLPSALPFRKLQHSTAHFYVVDIQVTFGDQCSASMFLHFNTACSQRYEEIRVNVWWSFPYFCTNSILLMEKTWELFESKLHS